MEVNRIIIPNKPHLDPIAAIYLLAEYGQDIFQGIHNAKISFWENSSDPSDEERRIMEAEGAIMIDVGGGIFDHHNKIETASETSASLVAAYLGVDKNPELTALLNYVREDDLEGLHNRYGDLAYLIKCLYKQNMTCEEVVRYALQIISFLQKGQMEWHYNVRKEYEEKCKHIKVKRFKRKLKIGIIESDNLQVANYGLTMENLSVMLQLRSTGHVMILTNKNHKIDLREIVAAIRKRELEFNSINHQIDCKRLQFEGKSAQIPNWFYHRSLNSFLNGSDALSKADPTKVPFKEIIRFVLYGLTSDESQMCDCAQGGDNCPYVNYGFSKCLEKKNKIYTD